MDWDIRESIWELKDILKSIDRFLEDSELTDGESLNILRGRDDLNQTLAALEDRA